MAWCRLAVLLPLLLAFNKLENEPATAFYFPKLFTFRHRRKIGVRVGMTSSSNENDPRAIARQLANTWLPEQQQQQDGSGDTYNPPISKSEAQESAQTYFPPKAGTNSGFDARQQAMAWLPQQQQAESEGQFDGYPATPQTPTTTATSFNSPVSKTEAQEAAQIYFPPTSGNDAINGATMNGGVATANGGRSNHLNGAAADTPDNRNPPPFNNVQSNGVAGGMNGVEPLNGNTPAVGTVQASAPTIGRRAAGGVKGVPSKKATTNDSIRQPYQYTVKKSARSKVAPKGIVNGNPPPFPDSSSNSFGSVKATASTQPTGDLSSLTSGNNNLPPAAVAETSSPAARTDFFFGSPAKQQGDGTTNFSSQGSIGGSTEGNNAQNTAPFYGDVAGGSSSTVNNGVNGFAMNNNQKQAAETPFFLGSNRGGPSATSIQESQVASQGAAASETEPFSQQQPLTPPDWAKPIETPSSPTTTFASSGNNGQAQYEGNVAGNLQEGKENQQPDQQWDGPFAEQKRKLDRLANKAAVAAVTYSIPVTAGTIFTISQGPALVDDVSKAYESLAAIPWTKPAAEVSAQNSLKSYMERVNQPWTDPGYAVNSFRGEVAEAVAGNVAASQEAPDNGVISEAANANSYRGAVAEAVAGNTAVSEEVPDNEVTSEAANENVEPQAQQQGPAQLSLYTEYLQNPNYNSAETDSAAASQEKAEGSLPDKVVTSEAPNTNAAEAQAPPPQQQQPTLSLYTEYLQNPNYDSKQKSEPQAMPPPPPSYADETWNRFFSSQPPKSPPSSAETAMETAKSPSYADYMWERIYGRDTQEEPPAQKQAPPEEQNIPSAADTMWERVLSPQPQQGIQESKVEEPRLSAGGGQTAADAMWERMNAGQQQPATKSETQDLGIPADSGPSAADEMWQQIQAEQQQQQQQQQQPSLGPELWPQTQPEGGAWAGVQPEEYDKSPADTDAWATSQEPEYQGQADASITAESQDQQTPESWGQSQPQYQAQAEEQVPAAAAEAEMFAPVSWAASQGYFVPTNSSLF